MQSLPTEAKPLSACSQCGTALPAPTGSATFVYGVGPVGYQSCNTCGAKWRYLWQDPPGAGGGLNRLPFLLVGTAIVVLIALGAGALLRSSTAYSAKSASAGTTTPQTRPSTSAPTTTTFAVIPNADVNDFLRIVGPVDDARSKIVEFVTTEADSSPQFEVNAKLDEFVPIGQRAVNELKSLTWPAAAAADVDQLVRASQQFINDISLVQYGLQRSESFTNKLDADVESIKKYEAAAFAALGATPPA